ncbi:hypothetical protein AAFF_G00214810 [Aldrovandia affinis]|uniref:EF-hand domain-containing protein n=1 Tax=Aldrovandia affinis TaxID=143900 RepID=A0AAD7RGL5_9TELE|nr:hypothetical protein AAFF_G00214810 [Aldrovandia affinis]
MDELTGDLIHLCFTPCRPHYVNRVTMSLESAVKIVAEVFHRYAGEDERKNTLSCEELKKLLQAECSSHADWAGKLTSLMQRLDENEDGQIDIVEFGTLIGMMAKRM